MIQFKVINGQICRMLEKPVPLTPDAQFPCVVRLIQDDSQMGIYNRDLYEMALQTVEMCVGIDNQNDIRTITSNIQGSSLHYAKYEILGYPVADGSAEWAMYRMMQGDMVFHPSDEDRHPCKIDNDIVLCVGCGMRIKIDKWVEGCLQKDGWQIYTPKPLLSEAKEGDLCQRRDGKWVQIDRLLSIGGMPWICYEIGGLRYINNGEQLNSKQSEYGIISTEPLAPEGSAEWAWQMAKLGIETRCYEGKIRVAKSGLIEVCYNGMAYDMPMTQSPDNKAYTIKKISQCSPTGWQLCEPKKELCPACNGTGVVQHETPNGATQTDLPVSDATQPKYEVGDWVEYFGDQRKLVGIPIGETKPDIKYWDAQDIGGNQIRIYADNITRKLSPSEVKAKITLEGTVRSSINDSCFELSTPNGGWATFDFNEIDPTTADLVRELIAKQEEK